MQLIGYGEYHSFTADAILFARFCRPDGSIFDMPVTDGQFEILMQGAREMEPTKAEAVQGTPPRPTQRPAPTGAAIADVDDDEPLDDEL